MFGTVMETYSKRACNNAQLQATISTAAAFIIYICDVNHQCQAMSELSWKVKETDKIKNTTTKKSANALHSWGLEGNEESGRVVRRKYRKYCILRWSGISPQSVERGSGEGGSIRQIIGLRCSHGPQEPFPLGLSMQHMYMYVCRKNKIYGQQRREMSPKTRGIQPQIPDR